MTIDIDPRAFRTSADLPIWAESNPGALLREIYREWLSRGRRKARGGHSFRGLQQRLTETGKHQASLLHKLTGRMGMGRDEARNILDILLTTWEVEAAGGRYESKRINDCPDISVVRDNILSAVFRNTRKVYLIEPPGLSASAFCEERRKDSSAIILPVRNDTINELRPLQFLPAFPKLLQAYFGEIEKSGKEVDKFTAPIWIWIFDLNRPAEDLDFFKSYYTLAIHIAAMQAWGTIMSAKGCSKTWHLLAERCFFVLKNLPGNDPEANTRDSRLEDRHFVPNQFPEIWGERRIVQDKEKNNCGMVVSVPSDQPLLQEISLLALRYWLFPTQTRVAENQPIGGGFPIREIDLSPGREHELAFSLVYKAVRISQGANLGEEGKKAYQTLKDLGWTIRTVREVQHSLPNRLSDAI